jgi:small-conductance mechanosensitive channel/CRP-like cAMP-binding protein
MNPMHVRVAGGLALLALTLVVRALTRNGLVRRKLRLPSLLFGAYVVLSAFLDRWPVGPELTAQLLSIDQLLLALAVIDLAVVALVNPHRVDRVPDYFPSIVQDTIVIGVFTLVATVVLGEKFLTTSAVGAVVIGFALQDTLGNTFAGLAIQVEKPFRVGHWVAVGPFEGQVSEVTWRATKLRTKTGNLVVLPNAFVSKEAIVNYSEPDVPTRLEVSVGVSYDVPPDQVKAAIAEALANSPRVLPSPKPDVLLGDFAASSICYTVRFWIDDYSRDAAARDQVRSAIYYALKRHRYEIPFPIQVEYHRQDPVEHAAARTERFQAFLGPIELFAPLSDGERAELAARASTLLFGAGETIVRQGQAGSSMFVVCRGLVRVVEASGRELATFTRGGYFGEMSMLTGQPRSASVVAGEECEILELTAESLRAIALANPDVLRRISEVVAARRADTERQKAEVAASLAGAVETQRSLLKRIQEFLHLPDLLGD